jgi:hypothetical protein
MFELNPNQLTPEEQLAVDQFAANNESRIEELVISRMLDPDCIIAAIKSLLETNPVTYNSLAALLMGRSDKAILIASIKLDCMEWMRRQFIEADLRRES